jgi:hypothetical protein
MERVRLLILILGTTQLLSCASGRLTVDDPANAALDDTGPGTNADTGPDTNADTDADAETNPLVGLVFVQGGEVGLASYHFDSEDDTYINYASFDIEMDDGQRVPEKKSFVDTDFALDNRTFRGIIDWTEPEGTTVSGAERWVYEMVFDDGYTVIDGGSVVAYDSRGNEIRESYFGSDLVYERLD